MRKANPLTADELREFVCAAGDLSAGYRLVGHLLPFTGLRANEFKHFHRDWIETLDPIKTDFIDADEFQIVVPKKSPCRGTLKFTKGNKSQPGQSMERRESGCRRCRPADNWKSTFTQWRRRIHVTNDPAVETIKWWFSRYDSIPCSGTIANRVKKIAREADIDRAQQLTSYSLRDTFGVLLLNCGLAIEDVVEMLGYSKPHSLRPLAGYTDRSLKLRGGSDIPDEVLVEEMQRLSQAVHRAPKMKEMNSRGEYSAQTYTKRFGSWNDALREAGLEPPYKSRQMISTEKLIDDLKQLAVELGHPPSEGEIENRGKHSPQTYRRRFGGIKKARDKAGLSELKP